MDNRLIKYDEECRNHQEMSDEEYIAWVENWIVQTNSYDPGSCPVMVGKGTISRLLSLAKKGL